MFAKWEKERRGLSKSEQNGHMFSYFCTARATDDAPHKAN